MNREVAIQDFLEFKYLSGLRISEDGDNAAFVLHNADLASNGYHSNIWIYNRNNCEYTRLTWGNREKDFLWMDNDSIMFSARQDTTKGEPWTVFQRMNITGGEEEEHFRLPFAVTNIKKASDGVFLFTARYDPNTPTLFIHSEQDYRCWLPEGFQMFTSLKYFGVESRFVMFRGEHHDLSRTGNPSHRIRRLEEIIGWFDQHLQLNREG